MAYRPVRRCLPAPFEPSKHKHPVAEIAELLRERLELLPVLADICGELFDALASAVAAAAIESPDDSRVPLAWPGMSLAGACLLATWCPAWRWRELGPGSGAERVNLSSRARGRLVAQVVARSCVGSQSRRADGVGRR
jgi:hypothetical protein